MVNEASLVALPEPEKALVLVVPNPIPPKPLSLSTAAPTAPLTPGRVAAKTPPP